MGDAILNRVFVVIFIEKLSLEQTPEGGELASHVTDYLGVEYSDRENRQAKGPGAESCLAYAYPRNSKEAT